MYSLTCPSSKRLLIFLLPIHILKITAKNTAFSRLTFYAYITPVFFNHAFNKVQAKAKDAKFTGSSIGGARIIVRDALSGTIMAKDHRKLQSMAATPDAHKRTKPAWLISGKDIEGDGLVLELPDFVVNILSSQVHENKTAANNIVVTANVVLMCGCPVTAGGIWDAEQYEVQALVEKDGELLPVPLGISEKANTFTAMLDARQPGLLPAYDVRP